MGFLAKYDPLGNVLYAKLSGVTGGENGMGNIVCDSIGYIYTTGYYNGYNVIHNDTINSYGSDDIYVGKYDNAGNATWFLHAGGPGMDFGLAIAIDKTGALYTTGIFSGGNVVFGANNCSGTGTNAFIAKTSSTTGLPIVAKAGMQIMVYPNPASANATIDLGNSQCMAIRISDCLGRIVYTQDVDRQKTITISTMTFANGIYFVTASGNEGSVSKKLIIEH